VKGIGNRPIPARPWRQNKSRIVQKHVIPSRFAILRFVTGINPCWRPGATRTWSMSRKKIEKCGFMLWRCGVELPFDVPSVYLGEDPWERRASSEAHAQNAFSDAPSRPEYRRLPQPSRRPGGPFVNRPPEVGIDIFASSMP